MRGMSQPVCRTGTENPKPGSEGATTWKASAGSPPWARGSVSGPMMLRNSTTELGYPWLIISGSAPGSGDRTCRKWMFWPSMVVVNCAYSLSFASHWRQLYPSCQYSVSSLRYPSGTPRLQPTSGSSSGQRVLAKRPCRSSSSASGILTRKGCTLISDWRLLLAWTLLRLDRSAKGGQNLSWLVVAFGKFEKGGKRVRQSAHDEAAFDA